MISSRDGDSVGAGLRPSLHSLPVELLARILCFLGPRDLVRLRSVSKLLGDISHDLTIWRSIYASAPLPRPPGPYPFQSARFLEQTLIRSERLGKHWTTRPIQVTSRTVTRVTSRPKSLDVKFIGDRWAVVFDIDDKRILFVDLETRSLQDAWEDTEPKWMDRICFWDACFVTSADGLLVYILFYKGVSEGFELRLETLKLLEFRVDDQSGYVSHSVSLDLPTEYQWAPLKARITADPRAPFLHIKGPARHLIFDTRTRTFYVFPEFKTENKLVQCGGNIKPPTIHVSLTDAHIIVFSHYRSLLLTLIQAFVLPEHPRTPGNETATLHLSHEGRLAFYRFVTTDFKVVLIRNPPLGSTTFRFLNVVGIGRLLFSCIDVTLPEHIPGTVLPISADITDSFEVDGGTETESMGPLGYIIETSDDGYARGLCRVVRDDDDEDELKWWFRKFTIDASGDKCVAEVGQAMRPRWLNEDERRHRFKSHWVVGRYSYLRIDPVGGSSGIVCVDFE